MVSAYVLMHNLLGNLGNKLYKTDMFMCIALVTKNKYTPFSPILPVLACSPSPNLTEVLKFHHGDEVSLSVLAQMLTR